MGKDPLRHTVNCIYLFLLMFWLHQVELHAVEPYEQLHKHKEFRLQTLISASSEGRILLAQTSSTGSDSKWNFLVQAAGSLG